MFQAVSPTKVFLLIITKTFHCVAIGFHLYFEIITKQCLFLECVARTPCPEVHDIQNQLYLQEAGSVSATQLLSTLARMAPQEDALAVLTLGTL